MRWSKSNLNCKVFFIKGLEKSIRDLGYLQLPNGAEKMMVLSVVIDDFFSFNLYDMFF